MKIFHFSGIPFASVDLKGAINVLQQCLHEPQPVLVATPNVNHVMRQRRHPAYRLILSQFDLFFADGMPIVWASILMNQRLPGRVTGADLLPSICRDAAIRGQTVFLAGGQSPEELNEAARKLSIQLPSLDLKTAYPNYGFEKSEAESMALIDQIKHANPQFVFLGVGSPKQEEWLLKYRSQLPPAVYVGCGMAIGFVNGVVKRAPLWIRKLGFEWVWRIYQEPRRLLFRYAGDIGFVIVVLTETFRYYLATQKCRTR